MPDVQVVEIDADNVEAALSVVPRPEQGAWVRPVAWYVARSAYDGGVWQPLALTRDGAVVGFAQAPSTRTTAPGRSAASWWMPGTRAAGGTGGVRALVDRLSADSRCRLVALTVAEDNATARALYRSLGFVETGDRDEDGELVMTLPTDPPA